MLLLTSESAVTAPDEARRDSEEVLGTTVIVTIKWIPRRQLAFYEGNIIQDRNTAAAPTNDQTTTFEGREQSLRRFGPLPLDNTVVHSDWLSL
jgi:hypothetical protein